MQIHLISFKTCPFVQRAVITLKYKNIDFDITYIDLADPPDWFLEISPHGKVPVLLVDDVPLFESNAIAEYLDEVFEPRLHPGDPIKRAQNRAWTDYVPTFSDVTHLTHATDKADLDARRQHHEGVLRQTRRN